MDAGNVQRVVSLAGCAGPFHSSMRAVFGQFDFVDLA
jgi:hypothetical protein